MDDENPNFRKNAKTIKMLIEYLQRIWSTLWNREVYVIITKRILSYL